jgi:hypothetical protein
MAYPNRQLLRGLHCGLDFSPRPSHGATRHCCSHLVSTTRSLLPLASFTDHHPRLPHLPPPPLVSSPGLRCQPQCLLASTSTTPSLHTHPSPPRVRVNLDVLYSQDRPDDHTYMREIHSRLEGLV